MIIQHLALESCLIRNSNLLWYGFMITMIIPCQYL